MIGVIGGLGPMATTKFMELVINNTKATCDQDNVDMLVCQFGSIPDRTAFILKENNENPVFKMIDAAKLLEREKVNYIVIPCNTASYFYDEIQKNVNISVINIVEETINVCREKKYKKIGLMATNGTINSKIYEKYGKDIEFFIPNKKVQEKVMSIIYDDVKQNKIPDKEEFLSIINYFKENNCDGIIGGCTEISVILDELKIDLENENIVDSLLVLAKKTILLANKKIK
jgi:aspartate racemase